MTTVVLSPNFFQQFENQLVTAPLVGGKLFTYAAGTSTKQATYTDSTAAVQNANPIILDSAASANVWFDITKNYKIVLSPANDTDPPTSPIRTVDNVPGWNGGSVITQAVIGALFYPQSTAELAAGVTPTNFAYSADAIDPRRYGAAGDGLTDDTAALNKWVLVVNASTRPVSTWPVGLSFLCSPLNAITANNFTWNMNSTILAKANSWSIVGGTFSYQVAISGSGARLNGVVLIGNQSAFSVNAPFGYLLRITGNDVLMDNCNLTQSPSGIASFESMTQGRFSNCHFDASVNSVNISACSYLKFVNCTANLDGYPFGTAVVPGVPQAAGGFGWSLRYRSHHITFANCEAQQCCLVGFNIDQGCYAIKAIGCVAWMNGDAGIALAADTIAGGLAGNGESCYDCEFVDCESYNNWGSGLSAYAQVYNCTVDSGRYYNNQRSAGQLVSASSAINGIYISGGSLGVRIRTKSYDDRQIAGITANAAGALTATGWVAGTMGNYPRVAIYNSTLVFQGWGTITAESAGSVTIATTANNGVTIGSIVAGWYVTQRTQNNGVFLDNGCTGLLDVDGFGFLPGVNSALTGFKGLSGSTGSNQNILLPGATLDYTELLLNPTWDAGTGTGVSWTYNLTGGGLANPYSTAGAGLRSPGSLQLIGGTSVAQGDSTLIASALQYVVSPCWVEASVWCIAVNAGDAQLLLIWNSSGTGVQFSVVNHPGGGWRQLKIGAFMPPSPTSLNIRVLSAIGKTNYFDNASLRVKSDCYDSRDYLYPTRNLAQ